MSTFVRTSNGNTVGAVEWTYMILAFQPCKIILLRRFLSLYGHGRYCKPTEYLVGVCFVICSVRSSILHRVRFAVRTAVVVVKVK